MSIATLESLTDKDTQPKFRDPTAMTEKELTDPDYRMKQLARQAGRDLSEVLVCSKCHHCR